jgi:crossover junction endodeoxyribonuclease RusA
MRIEVAGIPAPQGSKRHVGGGRMVEQSRAVGPWREAVRAETQRAKDLLAVCCTHPGTGICMCDCHGNLDAFDGPARVQITFRLPRPKSAPKSVTLPIKRPDIDKLARAVLDGLVAGGALADDSQVVDLLVSKRFATTRPGCIIEITERT